MGKPKKLICFFAAVNVVWIIVWGANIFFGFLPVNDHNPFLGLISPVLGIAFIGSFDFAAWWENTEALRPAIIYWSIVLVGCAAIVAIPAKSK
jgi:hypothetical protein